MALLKKENGFTLVEMVLVMGLMSILLLLVSTSYLAIHKNYIKGSEKSNNLDEARLVVQYLTDNLQKYEDLSCELTILGQEGGLNNLGGGTIDKITFNKNAKRSDHLVMRYNKNQTKVIFQGNEIASHISDFTVERNGNLYDFLIQAKQENNKAIPDQAVTLRTTINLKYIKE